MRLNDRSQEFFGEKKKTARGCHNLLVRDSSALIISAMRVKGDSSNNFSWDTEKPERFWWCDAAIHENERDSMWLGSQEFNKPTTRVRWDQEPETRVFQIYMAWIPLRTLWVWNLEWPEPVSIGFNVEPEMIRRACLRVRDIWPFQHSNHAAEHTALNAESDNLRNNWWQQLTNCQAHFFWQKGSIWWWKMQNTK